MVEDVDIGGRPKSPDGEADAAAPRIFAESHLAETGPDADEMKTTIGWKFCIS
jgi:hypothetical protein